jgi:hypothetical protein
LVPVISWIGSKSDLGSDRGLGLLYSPQLILDIWQQAAYNDRLGVARKLS